MSFSPDIKLKCLQNILPELWVFIRIHLLVKKGHNIFVSCIHIFYFPICKFFQEPSAE